MLSKINSCFVTKSNLASSKKSKCPNFTGMIQVGDLLIDAKKVYLKKVYGDWISSDNVLLKNVETDKTLFSFFNNLKVDLVDSQIKNIKKALAWAQHHEGPDILDLTNAQYGEFKLIKNDFTPPV